MKNKEEVLFYITVNIDKKTVPKKIAHKYTEKNYLLGKKGSPLTKREKTFVKGLRSTKR